MVLTISVKPNLRLFTLVFPQRGSEDGFVPSELECFTKEFNVEIVPSKIISSELHPLPDGVTVNFGLAKFSSLRWVKIWFGLRAVISGVFRNPRPPSNSWLIREVSELKDLLMAKAYYTKKNRSSGVEVAYSWWSYGLGFGAVLGHFHARRKFVGLRGDDFQDYQVPRYPYLHIRAGSRPKYRVEFISGSDFASSQLQRLYGVALSRVTTFYIRTSEPAAMSEMVTSGLEFRSVSCSNHAPLKRLDLMIRTLSNIALARPTKTFRHTHIGSLGPSDLELLNLPSNLIINQTGWLPHGEVTNVYLREGFDAFLHFSQYEGGVPVSMIEAASFGLPLIGFRAGGVPELCDSSTGLLMDLVLDDQEIVKTVLVLVDSTNREALGRASRQKWEQNFSKTTDCAISQHFKS